MGLWSTLRSIGAAFGIGRQQLEPLGCSLGRTVFREAKRSAQIANLRRPHRRLEPRTAALLQELFPELDADRIRVRTRCRLPANRFQTEGSIYGMTFGYTIYWRDELDETDDRQVVDLIHEVVHVDQVRRFGGEREFACEYGKGYVNGGGELPASIREPTAYHRNPLESEAYLFEARFQHGNGRVDPSAIPWPDPT